MSKIAKKSKGHNSVKIYGLCPKVNQVIYTQACLNVSVKKPEILKNK